ncbi:hypothetical protein BU17DRAFT_67223 [Hysterangium stoloniferum]|nr:hypothetical protein BU17DRAFT_67223 [Hysterangium stoloniferum]
MPHALFLGSSLATIAVFPLHNPHFPSQPSIPGLSRFQRVTSYIRPLLTPATGGEGGSDRRTLNQYRQNNRLSFLGMDHPLQVSLRCCIYFPPRTAFSRRFLGMEGFAFRLILLALVAALVGRSGINALLITSQVVLSIVLPFVVFPLVYLTSSRAVIVVTKKTPDFPGEEEETNYRNKFVMALGYMILSLIVVATHNEAPGADVVLLLSGEIVGSYINGGLIAQL